MRPVESFRDYMTALVRSGHQLVQISTVQERRVLEELAELCLNHLPVSPSDAPWRLVSWDFVNGYSDAKKPEDRYAGTPAEALLAIPTTRFAGTTKSVTCSSSLSGIVTALHVRDGAYVVVLDQREHLGIVLPDGAGPAVRVGDLVKAGTELAAPYLDNVLLVFKDPAVFLNTDDGFRVRRALRNLLEEQSLSNALAMRPVVFLGPVPVEHPELASSIVQVPYALPSPSELAAAVDYIALGLPEERRQVRPEFRKQLSDALRGFSLAEAHDTLGFLAYVAGGFHQAGVTLEEAQQTEEKLLREIHRRKRDKWAQGHVLELVDLATLDSFDSIGGYGLLKTWIARQKLRFGEKAQALRVRPPKGAVIGGLPGTGKSICATVIAKELRLPLVEFRFDALFSSLVGDSEARMRDALDKIKALGPCVVRVDEVDKMMAGIADGAGGDSGVSARVLGRFLSWQANENECAFVLMTLNRLSGLPPELLRSGRFDRVWWVDLPNDSERQEIIDIHLRKRNIDPDRYRPGEKLSLVETTRGATGADIEVLVEEARSEALFLSEGESATPSYAILSRLAQDLRTQASTSRSTLDEMRAMFEGRAYPVSDPAQEVRKVSTSQRKIALDTKKEGK